MLKRREDYDDASEEYAWRLLIEVSLSEERFHEVKAYIMEAAGLQEITNRKEKNINQAEDKANQKEDSLCKEPAKQADQHIPHDCLVLQ